MLISVFEITAGERLFCAVL